MASSFQAHHSRFFWRSTALFAVLDSELCFREINNAWEKLLNLSNAQLLARNFKHFIHNDDRPQAAYNLEQLIDNGLATHFACRFQHRNGSYRHILWEITAVASQEHEFYLVGMDISERERPSVADEILSVLHDGVVLQYANGTIGACNTGAERIIGLSVDNMIGWVLIDPDWQLLKEDGTPFPQEAHPAIRTLRTGKPYNDVIIGIEKNDNSLLWLRMNTYPLWRDEMTPYAVVMSFSDITLQKETEQKLRQQQSSDAQIYRVDGGELWQWDVISNGISFSDSWKAMLGYEPQELNDHLDSWHQRVHPMDYKQLKSDIRRHLEGDSEQIDNTHRLQHRNGRYLWIHCHAKASFDKNEKATVVVGMHTDVTEQQEKQREGKYNELKYQQLMDAETQAVILITVDSERIIEVNKACAQMYGYSKEALLEMRYQQLSAQSEKGFFFKQRQRNSYRRHHKRQDGSVFSVKMTVSPFYLEGKDLWLLLIEDVSEYQQTENALWESQSKYRQLFEAASNATIVFDTNTQQIFDVNNVAVEMYGYHKDEWFSLTVYDLSAESVKSRALLYTGKRRQTIPLRWHRKKDGSVFPVEITTGSSYLFQGRSLVCATLRDITERRAAEEALRSERDFSQTLVETSPTFFFAMNPDGSIRMVNKAMLSSLEYALDEILDKDFLHCLVPEAEKNHMRIAFDELVKTLEPQIIHSEVMGKAGEVHQVEWHSRAVMNIDGEPDYIFAVGIDTTEREEVQKDLHLFKTIIEESAEAINIKDVNGKLVYVNPAYKNLVRHVEAGADKQINYTENSLQIIAAEQMPALKAGKGWTGELDIHSALGDDFPIWQRTDAIRDNTGNILFIFELMHDISERKRMWETLRAQWQQYQLIFNNIPVMVWHRDKNNKLLNANQQATNALKGMETVHDFYTENQTVLKTGVPQIGETELYLPALGGNRKLRVGHIPCHHVEQGFDSVIVYAIDISDCHSGSSQSTATDQSLRHFILQLPLLVHAEDENGNLIAWNKYAEHITGYSAKDVINNPQAHELLYPQNFVENNSPDDTYSQSPLQHKDGSEHMVHWVNLSQQYPIEGWHTWKLGLNLSADVHHDNLLLDNMESALFRYIFTSTKQLGIYITDDRGRFVKLNKAYADMYGYQIDELLNQRFTLLMPREQQDEAIRRYFSFLISNQAPRYQKRPEQHHRSGRPFSIGVLEHRIVLAEGKRFVIGFVITES